MAARREVIELARKHEGIAEVHSRACKSREGSACSCRVRWRAEVWSVRDKRKIRKTFPTLAAAKGWRADAVGGLRRGTLRAPSPTTLTHEAEAWLDGVKAGTIRTRSGDPFKPSALRGYEAALRQRLLPELGGYKLAALERRDIQDFADRLLAEGLDPSTVRNLLMPLRSIFRRAISRGELAVNPTGALELPAVRGRRDRVAAPAEAAALIASVPEQDRAIWATAFLAGLRRGELQALRWTDLDLKNGTIKVERGWDEKAQQFVAAKSSAGRRTVPVPQLLRSQLAEHMLSSPPGAELVFGNGDKPFAASGVWRRARTAWKKDGLEPIGLHEARHSFASLMIAAGVNAKALSAYMGHSSVTITLDRYGHLMPGNEAEAANLLDEYLARSAVAVSL